MNISTLNVGAFEIFEKKVIIRLHNRICETPEELLSSEIFHEVLQNAVGALQKRNSFLLNIFGKKEIEEADLQTLIKTFEFLTKMRAPLIPKVLKGSEVFFKDVPLFNEFVEYLYNFWRSYDRFVICDSTGDDLDKRPYRTFSLTIGYLTNLVRSIYRDIQENLTGDHPRIYRQVSAGAEVATISVPKNIAFPSPIYNKLNDIAMIRQVLLYPPLILNPSMNKRSGRFERIDRNPLDVIDVESEDWLCYPAKVGELLMLIYFHKKFAELGFALCNLFELADDAVLQKQRPDAVYLFGVPSDMMKQFGEFPTVFYDDDANDLLVAAVPNDNRFGYFGYLKKMVLTLHNIKMMKKGRLPFHGALIKLILKGNRSATILSIGDTGAGKSETLEALRELGEKEIQDMVIVADDMGSLQIDSQGQIIGYGTEIGAFLRLDDLQPGYALGQIDRAIIMNANQVNARIILPVTTFDNVMKGHPIDFILYANNYEQIDEEHPLLEQFSTAEQAMKVFREGTVMSKGTTTSQGIVHSYFANIFGPPQYKQIHDQLANVYFQAFFDAKVFVGQIRTRLGLSGWERKGPEEAAKELLKRISRL